MQRLIIDIEESKSDILINLLQNLKDGVVKSFYIEDKIMDNGSKEDPYFYERKKELNRLRDDIKSGKEPMYDFNNSMDTLIAELES